MRSRRHLLILVAAFSTLLLFGVTRSAYGQTDQEKYDRAGQLFTEAKELVSAKAAGSLQAALPKLEEALRIFRETRSRPEEAACLHWLGYANYSLGNKQKAIDHIALAIPIYHAVGNNASEAQALCDIAKVYVELGDRQQGLKYYLESLPVRRAAGDKKGEAETLDVIGEIYAVLSDHQQTLKFYNDALTIFRSLGNKLKEARKLSDIGVTYGRLGEGQQQLKYFNDALQLFRSINDKSDEAITITYIGEAHYNLGDRQQALTFFNEALPLLRAIGDKGGEGRALSNIGLVYSESGENQQALKFYNAALLLCREVGDKKGEAATLTNIGMVYKDRDEPQQALKYLLEAAPLFRTVGDKRGEAAALNNIGIVYSGLGEKQQAARYYEDALTLHRSVGDQRGEATVLTNIGKIYQDLGNKQKALEYGNAALLLRRKVGDKAGEASTLSNIGAIYNELRDKQQALKYYNEALPLRRVVGDKGGEAVTLTNIGTIYSDSGDQKQALQFYNDALLLFRAVGDKAGEAVTLNSIGSNVGPSAPRYGVFYRKLSVKDLQILRSNVKDLDRDTQKTYLRSIEDAYRQLADALFIQGRFAEAQQVLDLFKDQQYFDLNADIQAAPLNLTIREGEFATEFDQKLERSAAIIRQLDEYKRRIGIREPNTSESNQIRTYEAELSAAKDDYLAFFKRAETDLKGPLTNKDQTSEIAGTRKMQTALGNLRAQTGQTPVSIYTLGAGENLRVLLITPDGIASASYPIKRSELNQKVFRLFGQLSEVDTQTGGPKSSIAEVQTSGKELYDIIFASVDTKLKELGLKPDVLMWSLDGSLRYLPVAALYDGKQYMAERFRNVVFTRADSERMLAPVSQSWTGTGFYNANQYSLPVADAESGKMKLARFDGLKNAKTELEAIFGVSPKRGIVAGDLVSNGQFTKDALMRQLKLHRPLVHIASHFKFEPGDAKSSFLVLGDGGKLTLEDIKQAPDDLFKGVELLTLSACETGLQKERESDGREIDGFAELAQSKGANAVLASLWKVDDESTSQLMPLFYQTRQKQLLTKAEALQKAQLTLLASRTFSHPFYWSPFVLIGNWR